MFVLAVLNEKLFAQLAQCIGKPGIVGDPRFATDADRLRHETELRAIIESWSLGLAAKEAVDTLIDSGVPAAEIGDIGAALDCANAASRGVIQRALHPELGPIDVPEQPARFSGVDRGGLRPAPRLDEHRQEILKELQESVSEE
jgi:CoA:oxalate CoA-transferase